MDGGDFGSNLSEEQKHKVAFLLRGMAMLNYDAINLADKDLQYGKQFLQEMDDEHDLPFISANVYHHGTDELFAEPYRIKTVGSTRIGIFGVTKQLFPDKMAESGFEIRDPMTAARAMVEKLGEECDVIIALAHLGLPGAKELAQEVPGIDFIVSGHQRSMTIRPDAVGETTIMQVGAQGKYLGHVEFEVGDDGFKFLSGKTVALSAKIPDDPELSALVQEYDDSVEKRRGGTH